MARAATKVQGQNSTNRRGHWQEEISKSNKRWEIFGRAGNLVVDRYRLERENSVNDIYQDRYNILYSSVETIRPSLYAQTPKVQATKRHRDRENDTVTLATALLETTCQFALEEIDFDEVMNNVVEDYLLPGIGIAWVRYVPTISTRKGDNDNETYEAVDFEGIAVDYVHYRDFRTGTGRVWHELPWIARRVFFNKKKATTRFGEEKANRLQYSYRPSDDGTGSRGVDRTEGGVSGGFQAVIWEIWDKENGKVVWYSEDYPGDVLDEIDDPLHLKDFFPCPRPIRAVHNTRTFVPKAYYSQYKAQAEELDRLTERIRYLTEALRAIGVYDGSQEQLAQLLNGKGNKMIGVQNWAAFAQNGGVNGSIQWVPIKDVAAVLTELLRQREIVKGEIYEISGFSDIVRGVSKASETLGAQEIKANWATGRLRDMQKEVQRFCRDIIRIVAEIISEQFSDESLALYAGFEPPPVSPEEQAAAAQYAMAMSQYQQQSASAITLPGQPAPQPPQKPGPTQRQQAIQTFLDVVKLLKDEKLRMAQIGIETDSTIQPDEAAERKDRMEFLGAAGAFLQQAGPMAMQYPDMRGLLGSLMMFVVRTFRASRPVEKEFEEFTKKLQQQPPMPPPGQSGEGGGSDPAAAQAKVQGEQVKAQATMQTAQMDDATERYKIDTEARLASEQAQRDHEFRMAELQLKSREVAVKERELGIHQIEVQHDQQIEQRQVQHQEQVDAVQVDQAERGMQQEAQATDRQLTAAEKEAAKPAPEPKKGP